MGFAEFVAKSRECVCVLINMVSIERCLFDRRTWHHPPAYIQTGAPFSRCTHLVYQSVLSYLNNNNTITNVWLETYLAVGKQCE